jgi:hypothetical protein
MERRAEVEPAYLFRLRDISDVQNDQSRCTACSRCPARLSVEPLLRECSMQS